ncbi:hypothetical protein EV177_000517 [Coemansia sp. RSA 1804]|nr:hypothetical protein EV177_000517 [Coemansia sp. RSA 1804]
MGFSTVDDRILERIMHIACHRIYHPSTRLSDYKELVPLAGVCKTWRKHASVHLCSAVIAEYQPIGTATAAETAETDETENASKRRPSILDPLRGLLNKAGIKDLLVAPEGQQQHQTQQQQQHQMQQQQQKRQGWETNLVLTGGTSNTGRTSSRLRIQVHSKYPDYTGFVAAVALDAEIAKEIKTIELVDLEPRGAAAWMHQGRSSHGGDSEQQVLQRTADYLVNRLPGIRNIVCKSAWDTCCAANTQLATKLVLHYLSQLTSWQAPVAVDAALLHASGANRVDHAATESLTALQIETKVLGRLGAGTIRVSRLKQLHLRQAEPYFSWAAFAADSSGCVRFENLHTLAINFERDDVANDTHRIEALLYAEDGGSRQLLAAGAGNDARVTMGVNRRPLAFPNLNELSVQRVPYTYEAAWSMFLESPVRRLTVTGKFGHLRYIPAALFAPLHTLDVNMYGIATAGGAVHARFTALFKQLLEYASKVQSAWLRVASDTFPLSVPSSTGHHHSVGWSALRELNIVGYLPPLALVALVGQLPCLVRLLVYRVVMDASETLLPPESTSEFASVDKLLLAMPPSTPGSRAVTNKAVRELQLHMGGSQVRASTLQVLCFLLTTMPCVRKLAIKPGYRSLVRRFVGLHADKLPELQELQMVHQIYMSHVPQQMQ